MERAENAPTGNAFPSLTSFPSSPSSPSCAYSCFNHLLLPLYSSKEKLEAKLKAAMLNSEGFGLR